MTASRPIGGSTTAPRNDGFGTDAAVIAGRSERLLCVDRAAEGYRSRPPPAVRWLADHDNDPYGSGAAARLAEVAGAAKSLGLELVTVNASDPAQFDAAFAQAEHAGAGAMLVTAVELFTVSRTNRDRLVELAAKHRLPAMFSLSETAETGGLISYSADPVDGYRQVGIYVGRILKGENPGDLPIMRPTKFTLAINLKTAKALGITVPTTLLAVADDVIE